MRILILSFYFRPDLCAGSFRSTALVDELVNKLPEDVEIDVMTTLPNRYQTYSSDAMEFEQLGRLAIHRVALPSHSSDMKGQSRAFLVYRKAVSSWASRRKYDLVFATSSRLMTAALGARIAKKQKVPLYLDIRDIFVDTIGDVLSSPFRNVARVVFGIIESRTMTQASHINLVSGGFENYFRERYPEKSYSFFTNGIDAEFLSAAREESSSKAKLDGKVTVLYAGNLGEGQALHTILPEMALRLRDRAEFLIIGDGGRRTELAKVVDEIENVHLLNPVSRPELIKAYREADVLFLHLGSQPAFEKVLPSKVFEYAAMGKPILAGVGGFAADFIAREVSNSAVFPPSDARAAHKAFDSLQLRDSPRAEFVSSYVRQNICQQMADSILGLLPGA